MPLLLVAISVVGMVLAFSLPPGRAALAFAGAAVLALLLTFVASPDLGKSVLLASPFMLPFVALAGLLGFASGLLFRNGQKVLGVLCLAPPVVLLWTTRAQEANLDRVLAGGLAYVSAEPRIVALLTPGSKPGLASYRPYESDGSRKLEYAIPSGGRTLYAIVDATRDGGVDVYRLRCVTTLSLGYRDPFKDPCVQGPVDTGK